MFDQVTLSIRPYLGPGTAGVGPFIGHPGRQRWLLLAGQLVFVFSSMAAVPDQAQCDFYNTLVDWARTAAGILTVLAILYLGAQKLAATLIPDIGIRSGYVVIGILVGLILIAFGEGIANAVLEAVGLPVVAC
jgi:hypothetical protein